MEDGKSRGFGGVPLGFAADAPRGSAEISTFPLTFRGIYK